MVTTRKVVKFWVPLSVTWLMMSIEGPILAAVIARLDSATYNLAAFGLAFAIAMLIESPVVNLLSAVVALVRDRLAAERLFRFMVLLNILVTVGMLIVCIPAVFDLLTYDIIGLPVEIGWRLHIGLILLIPWPAAIGYRRFFQGLLIRNNETRKVAYGTIMRLVSMIATAIVLTQVFEVEGVIVAASGLSVAVILEAAATRWMARGVVRKYREEEIKDCAPPPSNRKIVSFYTPLALTSVIVFVSMPMLSFYMNMAPEAVASLAVIPVVNAFTFMFRSMGFSFQEVGIAFLGDDPKSYPVVRRVAVSITLFTTLVMGLIVFTPLLDVVFVTVFGLEARLAEFARIPAMLMILMPATSATFALQRSVLITAHRTIHVTVAAMLEVGAMGILMTVFVFYTGWTGAVAAATAMVLGRVAANAYAVVASSRVRRAAKAQ